MATQEERLTAVEQFIEQAAVYIREIEENTKIMQDITRSQDQDIRHLVERMDEQSTTQSQHTELLRDIRRLVERMNEQSVILSQHTELLKALVAKEQA
jgi:hypothetical protein